MSNAAKITTPGGSDNGKAPVYNSGTDTFDLTDVVTAAEAAAAYQPLDSDLTAIAALSTTAFGRSLLAAANAAALRTLAGTVIGTDVQAWDADLDTWAGKTAPTGTVVGTSDSQTLTSKTITTPTLTLKQSTNAAPTAEGDIQWDTDDNRIVVGDGAATRTFSDDAVHAAAYQPLDSDLTAIAALATTAFGRGLLVLADAAALRIAAGLVIGTDVQAQDAELAALAALSSAADRLPYFTGSGTASLATFTAAGRALVDDADAAAQLTTLGVSAFAQTILDDANAAAVRSTIGTVIGTNVQAWDADLDAIAALTSAANKVPYSTGAQAWALADLTAAGRALIDDADAAAQLVTLGAFPATQTINAQTGTTYTIVLTDVNKLVTLSNASAITLTLPQDSDVAVPTGTHIDFAQIGAGQVTVAAGTGATVNATPGLKFRAQYSMVTAIKRAANTWILAGDLSA